VPTPLQKKVRAWGKDLLWFGWQEALSCVFAAGIFGGLIATRYLDVGIPRYDVMLIWCLLLQITMVATKLETMDELKVICLFHFVGLCLEMFKVHIGSWSYPDAGYARIGGVPLYSGFMYAAIASYMCQAWRRVKLEVDHVPMTPTMITAVLIYANFYTNHWLPDMRYPLVVVALILLRRSWIRFTVRSSVYRMHLSVAFLLIGFFIWLAENIGTFIGAWRYPNQEAGWHVVHGSKVGSWAILVIFSFMLILWLKSEKKQLTAT
jgi:uncharacterized membrane protein YoaT (DUF817 family)